MLPACRTHRHLIFAGLAVLAISAAAYFALLPYGGPPDAIQHPVHMMAFATISLLCAAALPRAPWLGLVLALALGAGLEGAQVFVPGRSAGLSDMVANLAGVLLGGAVYLLAAWHFRRTFQPS